MSPPPSPSGDGARPLGRLDFRFLLVVTGALLVFRLLAAGLIHLTEDEAYYRIWSLSPAFGYFDHPPMIAWWIWLGRHLAGDDSLGVRLLPVLASAVSSLIVFDLARLTGASDRTAARAGIWYNATFLVGAGAMLAIPDAPASLFWQLTVWTVLRALKGERVWAWWIAAGAAAGLACISKYSGLFLAPGVLLVLALTVRGRAQLKTPWPWLCVIIAAAIFSLNLIWNAEHHWLSFVKQFGRAAPHHFSANFILEFIAGQLLLLNPLIAVFAVRALMRKPRWFDLDGAWLFAAFSAPFFAYLLLHSLHDRVQAHWPSPLYPALAICAALAAEQVKRGGWFARLRTATPFLGIGLTCAALIYGMAPVKSGAGDPSHEVRGWSDFGRRLDALRTQRGAAWIGTVSYGEAAQLSMPHTVNAPVIEIGERDRYAILSHPPLADLTKPGVILDLKRRLTLPMLGQCFNNVTALGELDRTPDRHAKYEAFLVSSPKQIVEGGCWADDRAPAK
ncbi:MAG TPA: glycosyltransferase family 39 protein [Caulobacteraceae bacterium]|jgi:4-amino-4-deoxy-L-arabinose transferase-like glycosyltransferase